MNRRLREAASLGDIDSLYSIIEDDIYVLDRIDSVPFVDSPLHISASVEHIHFSLEMMRLKPSFAQKLNPNGYSPIHLALKNDQAETVLRLVDIDQNLVSLQGRDGLSSLHIEALEGKDKIVAKFLVSHPKSIKQLTIRKESALHITVKYGNIETLKILLEWTKQACMDSILNWNEDKGNNIMHLAALEERIEMVKLLIKYKVDIKSKNLEGLTALDILRQKEFFGDKKLRERIDDGCNIILSLLRPAMLLLKWTLWFMEILMTTDHRDIQPISKEDRNAVLVVSILIATTTYQVMLSSPVKEISPFDYLYYNKMCFLFKYFNTLAFVASMIEIFLNLPSRIGYTFHLVLPLIICYVLLMFFWGSHSNIIFVIMAVASLFSTKISDIRRKIRDLIKRRKLDGNTVT